MTLAQGISFALIIGAVTCFAWGRFRYDVISLVVLVLGVLSGVVPAKRAFSGFSSDVVVIIASALVVSAAVSRSGVIEFLMRPLLSRLKSEQAQAPVLVTAVTLLSMATKNVGALAILMPIPFQLARRTGTSPSRLLMPMSFASLLGGLVTLVGTSTNILVAQVRGQELGKPFGMFDFTPVGLGLSVLGIVFLSFAYRILPKREGQGGMQETMETRAYVAEAAVPHDWTRSDVSVRRLQTLLGDQVKVSGLVRGGERTATPLPDARVRQGDKVLLEGEQGALETAIASAGLKLDRSDTPVSTAEPSEEVLTSEAVVTSESLLNGRSARDIELQERYGANLLAISRQGQRITERIRRTRLQPGDVLVLKAGAKALPHVLRDLGLLPLAQRNVSLGGVRRSLAPIAILAVAMILVAVNVLPVAVAFFAAAVGVVAVGSVSMREAYESLDGPVLILIGALTPVSEAVRATGGTDLIADWLAHYMQLLPAIVALGLLMVTAMICSPFMHNAPTVLVLAPIAVSLARQLHLNPDPFLMGVATGAGCDFLTPIGHQCNTLVMGPGGYKFSDYARLGAPLSVMVILVGAPLIAVFWPLASH